MPKPTFRVEITGIDLVLERTDGGVLWEFECLDALWECIGPGNAVWPLTYVLQQFGVEFMVGELQGDNYITRAATAAELQEFCEELYPCSSTDFSDPGSAALYVLWEAIDRALRFEEKE